MKLSTKRYAATEKGAEPYYVRIPGTLGIGGQSDNTLWVNTKQAKQKVDLQCEVAADSAAPAEAPAAQ